MNMNMNMNMPMVILLLALIGCEDGVETRTGAGHADDTGVLNGTGGTGGTGDADGDTDTDTDSDGDADGDSDTASPLLADTAFRIDPPDSCANKFYPDGCVPGNPSSTCGGICQPRNACEGGESKDGEVGFACSRYMLFSDPMMAAAKADAATYGWGNTDNPPFNYAVAGHDTNSGGIDAGMSGTHPCCECYQVVFEEPYSEYSSPPPPKPLIIQVFNIAATAQSFDLYMGAGGFGAFNACADNGLAGTFGSYLYNGYPTQGQANDGGVKVVQLDECKDASAWGEATQTSISSAACQDRIESICNEVSADNSYLQDVTRRSCIMGNQAAHLYHQNWAVSIRRVTCPENLTRVTGCRLAEEPGLPAVDPSITTKAAAQAAGFLTGYHTTTMQDCCKPACAWSDNVGGAGKNVQAPWESIYTCTGNDTPML